jgi:hypothetical protein
MSYTDCETLAHLSPNEATIHSNLIETPSGPVRWRFQAIRLLRRPQGHTGDFCIQNRIEVQPQDGSECKRQARGRLAR